MRSLIEQGLEQTAALWPDIERAYTWIHQAAHILNNHAEEDAATVQRRFNGCDEFPLFAVLAEQMVDDILLRRGVQQHWKENFFLHGLMILIAKEPKERQDRPDIENFDTVSMFHDVNHPVENVQPPPENRMVSCDNFRTLHKPPALSF